MSNQWFYIRQWEANRKNIWIVVDNFGNTIKENINKYEAEDLKYILEKEDKNKKFFIVNKEELDYNESLLKNRKSYENN